MPGPELVLGTHDLQLSHMEALARDGAVGIQMLSQNPNGQPADVEMGTRVVPMETDCLFFCLCCLGI